MILTREEYEQIVRQKAKAESEAAVAKSNAAAAIEQADRDAQRKIREAAEETQEEINKIHQDLSEAESKIKYWQGLNENLLRISKERANADRKLKPKKEHTGYVVVSSTEKEYRYKVNRRDFETVMLWETVLQTPYPIDFTEEQAREETKELIGNDGRGNWLIARLCSKGGFGQIIVLDTGRLSFPIPSRLGLFRQICGHIDSWNAAVV